MNASTETRHDTRQTTVTKTNIEMQSDSNLSTQTGGDER